MAPHSVTVTPKSSTLLASLPDGRRMVYGKNYSITWEEFERLSANAKAQSITVVSYDAVIKNRKGTDFTTNTTTVPTNYTLGTCEEGVQRFDAAMLIKVADQNVSAGDVLTWASYANVTATSKRSGGAALSPLAFAGVAIAGLTNGRYGWLQIGGEVTAKVGSNVAIGDALSLDPTNDGALRKGILNESYTLTSDRTTGTFTLTYGGQTLTGITPTVTAATLQTNLAALSSVGAGNVAVTGGPLGTSSLTITFQGTLGGANVADLTANFSGLSGGTAATLTKVADGYSDSTIIATAITAYNSGTASVALRGSNKPKYRRIQNRRHWFN